ncbi:hypothetical protein TNIN_287821 [Trichonephila inaurata madagascariensis]|uniref:Uncharacterized protein n=1 Tax=Trichonephila inaurata madagascariensis TaxID=2747483 RepID=A0A8X6Y655_9ARAC|nr:hypothetical protein TNIN_287821 [Trichonephila inaurata madagascariensis]
MQRHFVNTLSVNEGLNVDQIIGMRGDLVMKACVASFLILKAVDVAISCNSPDGQCVYYYWKEVLEIDFSFVTEREFRSIVEGFVEGLQSVLKFAGDFVEMASEGEFLVEDDTQVFHFVAPGDVVPEQTERL